MDNTEYRILAFENGFSYFLPNGDILHAFNLPELLAKIKPQFKYDQPYIIYLDYILNSF
jgi:hypothetical protein